MRKQVSEKTLEINLCGEILPILRKRWGAPGAFWMGMKQDQEFKNGIDVLLNNCPGRHLILQFKSPHARGVGDRFTISDRQTDLLRKIANRFPNAVFYVLPGMNRLEQMRSAAPTFLDRTRFLRVGDLAALQPSTSGRHALTLEWPDKAIIRSEPIRVATLTGQSFAAHLPSGEGLVPTADLASWKRSIVEGRSTKGSGNLGQSLRGLVSCFVPQ